MNWACEEALKQHGWKKSQNDGGWFRRHDKLGKERRTEFANGPYLPEYKRDVKRILKLAAKKD